MHSLLQITTLGRLSVERDGLPLTLRRKDVLLLVYVALERRPVSRAEAAGMLWGETPDQAARLSLRQAIWRLRTETADAISANTTHITVDHANLSVDVENLAACVEAGCYHDAISLWQGDFLAGADSGATNEFESWVERTRAKTSQQIALSLSQLVRDAVRTNDWQQAARFAAHWYELAPRDSSAVLELARALRAGGKAAEGLARLTEFSRTVSDAGMPANAEVEELTRELRRDAVRVPTLAQSPTSEDAEHVQLIKIWEQERGNVAASERACRYFIDWIEARGQSALILRAGQTAHVVRALIEGLRNARGLSGAPDDALAELAAWSPSLRDRYPRLPAREADPALLTSALRRVLDAISVETPICIYIDDACDEESDGILTALMSDPPPRTMLLRAVKPKRRRFAVPLVAALVLITSVGVLVSMRRDTHGDEPVAVGVIQVIGERDTLGLSHAVPGLLASKLAMSPQLDVISSARMHEFGTARRAGARTLIEGEMYQQKGEIRLALRRVRISTGKVEKSYEVSSANVFRLVDEMADQIARSYHVDVPRQSVADVTTTSIVAYRFYEEGLRSFYRNDYAAAYRVFRAALEQDSSFAMAAFYASQSAALPDESRRLWDIALRLGEHAGDHDRLLIQAQWAVRNGSHNLYPLAETLSIRYPADAVGQYYYGLANNTAGNFMRAAEHFSRAVTLDSVALLGRSTTCRACEAMNGLLSAYQNADSMAAAERVARKWVRLQPWSLNGWTALGGALEFQGKYAAAESAYVRAEAAQPELSDLGGHRVELAIRAGRFNLVDSLLAHGLAAENGDESGDALWKSVLSYRTQGRLREALRAARMLKARDAGLFSLEARVLMDMHRYREAALLYDSAALAMVKQTDANTQRTAAAWFTNEATALVAMRDTARLDDLERWVRHYGSLSSEMRDRTLYHYVNAMRRELAGDLDGAIIGYRAAVGSPIGGNVRASLALGRALTARGRAAEALPVLDAAIRGALGASGFAVTKTELHEAFAQALDASGHTARAINEYGWVANAWRRADPEIVARRMRSEQRIAALTKTR